MTPEQAVAYTEALCRHHGIDSGLTPAAREEAIRSLHAHPGIIDDYVRRAELNIEQAAARKKRGEAA